MSTEVAEKLDPSQSYGVWWYNRRSVTNKHSSEPDGNGGKRYKARTSVKTREKEEWVAVPVPAYLPRRLVDKARIMIESRKGNERKHRTREWELKNLMRCSCGQNMIVNTSRYKGNAYHYYRCKREAAYGRDACSQRSVRIEKVEPLVWEFISGVLKDPEKIRTGLEALIERGPAAPGADPSSEIAKWEAKLAENTRLRRAYQDQQAAGLMTLAELRSRLGELDEARATTESELRALKSYRQRTKELEEDREAVLVSLAEVIPDTLDELSGDERNRLYRMLCLTVTPVAEGFEASGVFCSVGPTPEGRRDR